MSSLREMFLRPLIRENPVTLHVLGICSALAITNSLTSSLIMSVSMTAVLVVSSAAISLIRHYLVPSIRLIVQIIIIASAVTIIDQLLTAYLPEVARTLSVYISLIVTNCIVLGRAEACAMHQPVRASVMDALGNGLGYSLILIVVAIVRELFGNGSLMGYRLLQLARDGGWYEPNELLLLPPSAFFLIGFIIWVIRTHRPEQQESEETRPFDLPGNGQR
jgi:Na+-transporting NADH:ubiquinone oxidoreductase subunit D